MASIRYRKSCKRWEVRRSVKNPLTGQTTHLCRLLPPNTSQKDAKRIAGEFDRYAHQIRLARFSPSSTISIASQAYLASWKSHSAESYRHYSGNLQEFLKSLPSDLVDITQITPMHITSFVLSIIKAGFKSRTANAKLTVVKSFCHWCCKIYRVPNAAAAVDFLQEQPPNRRFLTEAELSAILADVTLYVRDRLLFLANTGLRASELCGLTWSCLAPDYSSLAVIGKGSKPRTVPLNTTCRDILNRLSASTTPQPNSHIFLSKSTSPLPDSRLTRSGLFNTCQKIAQRLNLKSFGPHAFRHYFATKMITSGTPVAIVSKILGHASTETTELIYTHILPAHLAGATECLVQPTQ